MILHEQIKLVLETQVRPLLHSHGGDIRLAGSTADGIVTVELTGVCSGCPSAGLSTRAMIEKTLQNAIPGVTAVELFQPVPEDMLDFAWRILIRD